MSRSTQDKVMTAIETAATDYGFEVIDNQTYSNTGELRIEDPASFDTKLILSYSFQAGYYTLKDIEPKLPNIGHTQQNNEQIVYVAATPTPSHTTTSADVLKAIRNILAKERDDILAKEFKELGA